jgi:hypothetical protein
MQSVPNWGRLDTANGAGTADTREFLRACDGMRIILDMPSDGEILQEQDRCRRNSGRCSMNAIQPSCRVGRATSGYNKLLCYAKARHPARRGASDQLRMPAFTFVFAGDDAFRVSKVSHHDADSL